ncbi:hypothetical protein ABVK25_008549 [Lepraria finkii]|uniref:Uncharacterized protein n=1 Tax=Lepraria finkii TaxID=1340010 RepID=A0ABR4B0M1_9LECA
MPKVSRLLSITKLSNPILGDALVTQETFFSTQVSDQEQCYAPLAESFGTHASIKEHESTYGPIKHMAYDFDISR